MLSSSGEKEGEKERKAKIKWKTGNLFTKDPMPGVPLHDMTIPVTFILIFYFLLVLSGKAYFPLA